MKNNKSSHPIRLVFFIVLIVSLACLSLWGTASFRLSVAQNDEQITKLTVPQREVSNLNRLKPLLLSDGISTDETILLPARVNQSRTILVRWESAGISSLEKQFTTEVGQRGSLSLLKIKPNQGSLTRQRSFELSPNELLIVMVNQNNQMLWWDLTPDPRLLRAESADAAGNLSGKTLYRAGMEMLVSYPSDEKIAELRFYHPSWDGQSYSLESIGNLPLTLVVK